MYRFLGVQGIPIQNACFMPKQTIMQRSAQICSFCSYNHRKVSKSVVYHQIRGSASLINLLELQSPVKKKMKQRFKSYVELLEVTDKVTKDRKAAVQKLNSARLSMLIKQPEVTVSIHHKLGNHVSTKDLNTTDNLENNMIHSVTGNMTRDRDAVPHGVVPQHWNESVIVNNDFEDFEDANQIDDISVIDSKVRNIQNVFTKTTESEKSEKSVTKGNVNSVKKQHSGQHINMLLAHIDVYLHCGMLHETKKLLKYYRFNTKPQLKSQDGSATIYNAVMQGYASKGDFRTALVLYDAMKKDCVLPTPQTYTIILDALIRGCVKNNQIYLFGNLQSDMDNYGISYNDIINKSQFREGQQENVLTAIKMLQPDFEPSYTVPETAYTIEFLKTLETMNGNCASVEDLLTIKELQNLLDIQINAESRGEVVVESIEKQTLSPETILQSRQKIDEVEKHWTEVISNAFDNNLKYLKDKERNLHSTMLLHPFLQVLNKEDYVNAILREIREIVQGSPLYSTPLSFLCMTLGKYIYKKYEMRKIEQSGTKDTVLAIYQKYIEWCLHPKSIKGLDNTTHRTVWTMLEYEQRKKGKSVENPCTVWPTHIQKNIGKFLYNIILHDVVLKPGMIKNHDIKHSIPAFYTLFRTGDNYLIEQVKPHPYVIKLYKDTASQTLTFETTLIPCYSPPRPWTSVNSGGYIVSKLNFIRSPHNSLVPLHKVSNAKVNDLYPVFDSLNQLGSVPWTINRPILDIVIKIFQDGGSEELSIPLAPSVVPPPPKLKAATTKKEKQKLAKQQAQHNRHLSELHSLRCDALYKLSLANHFRDKIFWLPHNVDFRGRVYPIPPHLNHLSADLGRAILLFAQGKPLGPRGLDWLKIHVVNLTGLKKTSSIEERLRYGNEILDVILDSASKPLTGKMWWSKSDEPWQTLAACMEIANAMNSPNPEKYESKFPVHQDGSCNGLQHYAALGRDQIGAESVNLVPFDAPKDVYAEVTAIVEQRRKADANNGVVIAKQLEGFIKRKVIKQTVMTTVYGVTKYGAKYQIIKQLTDIKDFPQDSLWKAGYYLTDKTFESIGSVFKSAKDIQDWFIEWARVISSSGACVEWVTPLGFPVVQPYVKKEKNKCTKRNLIIRDKPDSVKQKNAFPPNFIHSLDSTHMMLTSLHCDKAGMTFVSVHDCYWTHPCTVDMMNKICREQFVALHSQPIIENVAQHLIKHYEASQSHLKSGSGATMKHKLKKLKAIPKKGDFDINNVLSSTYFFS